MTKEKKEKIMSFAKNKEVAKFVELNQINNGIKETNKGLSNLSDQIKAIKIPTIPEFPKFPEQKEVVFPENQKINGNVVVDNLNEIKLDTDPLIWASGNQGARTEPLPIDFYGLPFSNGLTIEIADSSADVVAVYE